MALLLAVAAGCGGSDDQTVGTGEDATLHGYCTTLHRMNRELGSLATVREGLADPAETRRALGYLRAVRDHAPGELSEIWQDVIEGYEAQSAADRTDRNQAIEDAAAKAAEEARGGTRAEVWKAVGEAGYAALEADEKADATHERTARRLHDEALPTALASARGACRLGWERG